MDRDDMITHLGELLGSLATRDDAELLFRHLRTTGAIDTCDTGYTLDETINLLGEYEKAARRWLISSQSGSVFGVYQGATAEAAFDAMIADAGATDAEDNDGNPLGGSAADWIITEVGRGEVVLDDRIVDMAAARALMDDDICESIHGTVNSDQQFLDAYLIAHRVKYGAEFVLG